MTATAIGLSLIGVSALALIALWTYHWHQDRRARAAWEAGIAAKPGGPALLEWLREQRVYWRVGLGCVRPVPATPADIDLNEWERDEIARMEMFWACDGERQQREAS